MAQELTGKETGGSIPCPLTFVISRLAKWRDSAVDQGTKCISRSPLMTCL